MRYQEVFDYIWVHIDFTNLQQTEFMKNLQLKMVFSSILIVGASVLLSSCDKVKNFSGTFMTDQESINITSKWLGESIDATDVVNKIVFTPKENAGVTKYAGMVDIYLYEQNNDSLKLFSADLTEGNNDIIRQDHKRLTPSDLAMKKEDGVPFTSIDFSKIAKYIMEAGDRLVAEGKASNEPYFFSGVGEYTINLNKDSKLITHEFTIESKDTTKSSNRMVYYDEFGFKVDEAGIVLAVDVK